MATRAIERVSYQGLTTKNTLDVMLTTFDAVKLTIDDRNCVYLFSCSCNNSYIYKKEGNSETFSFEIHISLIIMAPPSRINSLILWR